MNIDEREQLSRFLEQLAQAQATQKDSEADALIRATCARQADAAYLLVQRAMLLDAAVRNSQNEIARLQGELDQARNQLPSRAGDGRTAFIDANAWGNSPVTRPTPALAVPPAAAPVPYTAQTAAPAAPPSTSAWGSGMLGTMATTAAGVVAGGFLFQGIGHLLGNSAAHSGSANGLSQPTPAAHDNTALNSAAVDSPALDNDGDIFDTSSVDDYIAGDDNA